MKLILYMYFFLNIQKLGKASCLAFGELWKWRRTSPRCQKTDGSSGNVQLGYTWRGFASKNKNSLDLSPPGGEFSFAEVRSTVLVI